MGGVVSDWHKQQHKKQVLKNKEARIAARDERVVHEKTIPQVRDEIRKLERQYKQAELRPHPIQSKLDRLNKELKLLQKAAEAKVKDESSKQAPQRTATASYSNANSNYVELDNPAVSVYFDAVLNPYGAPPPGQPRHYHRRGGGTTTNLAEACTLEEQFLPPPPPPPPPKPSTAAPTPQSQRHDNGKEYPSSRNQSSSAPRLQQSTWRNQKRSDHPDGPSSRNEVANRNMPAAANTARVDPSRPPTLPAPSAAVQRAGKSVVDIWASTEEVAYEAKVSCLALEGVGTAVVLPAQSSTVVATTTAVVPPVVPTTVVSTKKTSKAWYYQDLSGTVQGPYSMAEMRAWVQAGFFPHSTLTARHATGPWQALQHVPALLVHGHDGAAVASSSDSPTRDTVESSVSDRIAALRQSAAATPSDVDAPPLSSSSSVQDRIAALRSSSLVPSEQNENDNPPFGTSESGHPLSSVQDRIAALHHAAENGIETSTESSVAERIAALRAHVPEREPAEQQVGITSTVDQFADSLVPPPPPPPLYNSNDESVAPYLIAHDESAISFSAPNAELAYPIEDGDIPYPVDEEEEDDEGVTGAYDTADLFFLENDSSEQDIPSLPAADENIQSDKVGELPSPPQKKIKVDKSLVALLPSQLQKRKSAVPRNPLVAGLDE
jgi:GYF domain/mRNA biogenesis factor/WW domain binding protein 11